jgi:hypothetical protein
MPKTFVEYTLRVTDTSTGEVRTYVNPSGELTSGADLLAFGDGFLKGGED